MLGYGSETAARVSHPKGRPGPSQEGGHCPSAARLRLTMQHDNTSVDWRVTLSEQITISKS